MKLVNVNSGRARYGMAVRPATPLNLSKSRFLSLFGARCRGLSNGRTLYLRSFGPPNLDEILVLGGTSTGSELFDNESGWKQVDLSIGDFKPGIHGLA